MIFHKNLDNVLTLWKKKHDIFKNIVFFLP
jgi:hypothetical protein